MGIAGLHQELRPYTRAAHVENFAGQRCGVDGYSWLHKGVFSCAFNIATGQAPWRARGQRAPYVEYCLHRVRCAQGGNFPPLRLSHTPCQMRLLRHHGITPTLVFDGDRLPAKAAEEAARHEAREGKKKQAHALLASGDRAGAETAFQACVDVTPSMAREVMDACEAEQFAFLCAPYEADSQLAHLALTGQVELVFTEDSDLVAFGCPHVLFKLAKDGSCMSLMSRELFAGPPPGAQDEGDDQEETVLAPRRGGGKKRRAGSCPLSFRSFDQALFLCMCVLAGCDYQGSMAGVGIRKAHALAKQAGSPERLLALLRRDGRLSCPEQRDAYLAGFSRALATFRHARVFDATQGRLVTLTPMPAEMLTQETEYLGADMTPEHAVGIAYGVLCPFSRLPFAARAAAGPRGRVARGGPPLANWPAPQAPALRRSSIRLSDPAPRARAPPPPPPPRRIDSDISGMGHLLRMQLPAPELQREDPSAAPPSSSNPFARRQGAPEVHTHQWPSAAAATSPPPPPPPPPPPLLRCAGASSQLGQLWKGALSCGAAWLESPSKVHARLPQAGAPPAPATLPPAPPRSRTAGHPAHPQPTAGIKRFFQSPPPSASRIASTGKRCKSS